MQTAILFLCLIVGAIADGHGRSCLSGSVTYNDEGIIFDGTKHMECQEDQTACYQIQMEASLNHSMAGEWTGYIMEGGCFNPDLEYMYNYGIEAAQAFAGSSATINSFDFQSCNDSSDCFDFRPAGSEETVHCYSGVTVYEDDNMVFSAENIEQCRVYDSCETVTVHQQEGMKHMKYVYTGCGDPYNTIYEGLNVLPYLPPSEDENERQQACQRFGMCYETIMGLCVCSADTDTSAYATNKGLEDKLCTGDFCNTGNSFSGVSCYTGTSIEMTTDTPSILYDDTHEVKCSASETQCWWMITGSNVGDEQNPTIVRSSFGGCLNPEFRDEYDVGEDNVQQYLPQGQVLNSYFFDTCEGEMCNNYRNSMSMPTIQCNTGLTVLDGEGHVMFHEQDKQQCRVHDFCETVTLEQEYDGMNYHFIWTGCGDPVQTRMANNMVPFVPVSSDAFAREMQCSMMGNCTEAYIGLCMCPTDFENPATAVQEPAKEQCSEDFCNKGWQPFSCFTGNTIRNNDDGMLLFDESMEMKCENGEDACWWSEINAQTSDYNINMRQGGCMFSAMADMYDIGIEGNQLYYGDNTTLSDYNFYTCNDSNCNNYRPDDSQATVMCQDGVHIKNNMGEDIFHYAEDRQCRVHDTCVTASYSQTPSNGTETYYFTFTGCGDPFMTRPSEQSVPIVTTSANMADTEQMCMEMGCSGLYLAVCVCPQNFDFEGYASYSQLESEECNGDFCNKESYEMDPCDSNPCGNFGSCVKSDDGHDYMCYCFDGSQGHSCDAPPSGSGMWCMTGERVSMNIVGVGWYAITNNAAFAACAPEDGMTCVQYVIEGTAFSGLAVRMDFGECISTYETVDCSPYQQSAGVVGFMNVDSCETNQCSESYCNDFGNMHDGYQIQMDPCRQISTDSELGMFDFRVFPNCSATEMYHGIEKCVMQFGNQFPFFNNPDQCQTEADGMVKCMADLVQTCLSTPCPTLLDSVPGLRAEYHVIRFFASQINGMDALFDTVFSVIPFSSTQEQQMIRDLIGNPAQLLCVDPNNLSEMGQMLSGMVEQLVQLVGGSLDLNDIMGQELASQFFCSNDIITQVMSPALTMLPSLIDSQSEADVCNTFVDFANNMIRVVTTRCDFSQLGSFLQIFLPAEFPAEIFGAVQTFIPLISQLQIPRCAEPYDPCNYRPCNDEGVCQHHGDGHYTCYCYDGSSGMSCPAAQNPCDSNPCNYQGSCVNNGGSHWCYCNDGSEGHTCPGETNPCDSNPCGNQGSCMNNGGSYTCYCNDGSQGQTCPDYNNPCESNPCNNQGSCMNNGGSYTCYCYDGSQGQTCPGMTNPCDSNPCNYQGSCVNNQGSHMCYCYDGSIGHTCPEMNPCDSNPCGNQGSCMNNGGSYTCYCFDGSQGQSCEGMMNPCDSNPCNYQGSCVNNQGSHMCYCYDGSIGHTCPGGPSPTPTPGPDDQFDCEQYYAGTSACEMRKAWLCDYARWRWTTLTVWLNQFHEFVQNTGHQLEMEMPHCNHENEQIQCRNPEMQRCRHNHHMDCNECYCADHEYSNLDNLMDHWRHDYRAWASFFQEYRRVMQNNGGFGQNHGNDTC